MVEREMNCCDSSSYTSLVIITSFQLRLRHGHNPTKWAMKICYYLESGKIKTISQGRGSANLTISNNNIMMLTDKL